MSSIKYTILKESEFTPTIIPTFRLLIRCSCDVLLYFTCDQLTTYEKVHKINCVCVEKIENFPLLDTIGKPL